MSTDEDVKYIRRVLFKYYKEGSDLSKDIINISLLKSINQLIGVNNFNVEEDIIMSIDAKNKRLIFSQPVNRRALLLKNFHWNE